VNVPDANKNSLKLICEQIERRKMSLGLCPKKKMLEEKKNRNKENEEKPLDAVTRFVLVLSFAINSP